MAKKESGFVNMVVTLFLVTGIAALTLSLVADATKEKREEAKKAKIEKAIKAVLPPFENTKEYKVGLDSKPLESIFRLSSGGGDSLTFYEGINKDGEIVGVAVKSFTDAGFSGRFWIIAGFYPDGKVYDVKVVEHKETPGLGDKMEKKKSDWSNQFKEWSIPDSALLVTKDGGKVDAITASTISSRAFCDALQRAYDTYKKQKGGNK